MTKSADQIVAEKIVEEFRKRKLVKENRLEGLAKKLAEGRFSSEDWKLMAELEIENAKEGENGEST